MPQLDATSFPSQLFWLTVSFVMLYVLLAFVLLPKVQSVLAQRKRTIDADIEQAEQLKSEAARAEEQYEKALAEARAASQATMKQTQASLAARAADRRAELDAAIEKKLAESEAAVQSAKRAASEKLAPAAGDLASLIVEVLVHEKPDARAIAGAISVLSKERNL